MVRHTRIMVLMLLSMLVLATTVAAEYDLNPTEISFSVAQGSDNSSDGTFTYTGPDTVTVAFVGDSNEIIHLEGPNNAVLDVEIDYTPSDFTDMQDADSGIVTIKVTGVPDDQALGDYSGSFNFSIDNESTIEQGTWGVSVTVVDDNSAPRFTSDAITEAVVGQEYEYQALAEDDEGDDLTFSLIEGPNDMDVTDAGLVTWTPSSAGDVDVVLNVTDGEFFDQQSYTITVLQAGGTIQFSDVTLGDDSQEREVTVTKTFAVSNSGAEPVTGLTVTGVGISSKYDVNFSLSSTTIPADGGTVDVTVELYIPDDQDAGVFDIGDIRISGNGASATTHNLLLETENHLEISKIKMIVNDDETQTVRDGDTIDDGDIEFRPGDDISFEITVENTFDKDSDIYDLDIESITVYLECNDGEIDWDEDDDPNDLRAEKDDTITFNVDIPSDADEDEYDVTIYVEGTDENGAEHGETIEFTLDLTLKNDDIRITDASFYPTTAQCGENVRATIDLDNVGEDDQDEAVIRIQNNELDIEEIMRNINIDSGDELTRQLSFNLPKSMETGLYYFVIEVFTSPDEDDQTDIISESLLVNCGESSSNGGSNNNDDDDSGSDDDGMQVDTTPPVPTTTTGQVIGSTAGRPKSGSLGESTIIWMMIIVVILLIILIVLLLLKK